MRTLYRNATVCTPAHPAADALLVDGARIAWLGRAADAPSADTVVDGEGGVITPAFVDAHVHATDTGLAITGLDLTGTACAAGLLSAVERQAAALPVDAVVLGHGWDESRWPDHQPPSAAALHRAAGGRPVYLSRVDAHSALASTALLAAVPAVVASPGYDASGWLRQEAHHAVRVVAMGSISPAQRRAAQQAALRRAAQLGIAAVHECGGPELSDEEDFAQVLGFSRQEGLPEVFGFWGELGAVAKARELGAAGAGGDLFVDGAIGSRTAHLREPYVDHPRPAGGAAAGHGYLTSERIADHVVACVRGGMQAGFHAIGDGALATVLAGFAEAATVVGRERLRAGHHRVEHAELLDRALIARMVEYGLIASVQPAFDRLWGGDQGMYALRLGARRALAANPFAALAGVGVPLAFGSDSPVTPMDPWGAVLAAMRHHNETQRLGVRAAFAAHTRGGWRAVGRATDGVLLPGAAATFALWDAPAGVADGLPRLVAAEPGEADPPAPRCRRTVHRGVVLFDGSVRCPGGAR